MKILLAEDDLKMAKYLCAGLSEHGHSVDHVTDGRDALSYCLYNDCNIAIVDRMMPGMDGLSVVRALRAAHKDLPILFLTAMSHVDDRVEGLSAGGDDYLVKPFHFSELLARIIAITRRKQDTENTNSLEVHDLQLDLLTRMATRQGKQVKLHSKEFALLEILMRHPGHVITRTMLLERVWNFHFEPNTTVVETHMSRLRSKIDKPFDMALIHTIRNTGYTLHGPR
nr:response regulator transcription factor [uncultured Halomonas sp.]